MQFRAGMQCNIGLGMKTDFAIKFQLLKAKGSYHTEEAYTAGSFFFFFSCDKTYIRVFIPEQIELTSNLFRNNC